MLRIMFEFQQEPMRFIIMLRIMFELQQEPMSFIIMLCIMFELQQEPMKFILVLCSTFELFSPHDFVFLILRIHKYYDPLAKDLLPKIYICTYTCDFIKTN